MPSSLLTSIRGRLSVVILFSFQVTVDKRVSVCSGELREHVALGKFGIVASHLSIIEMSADNSLCSGEIPLDSIQNNCESVDESTQNRTARAFPFRRVFIDKEEIVSEIEISFSRIALG